MFPLLCHLVSVMLVQTQPQPGCSTPAAVHTTCLPPAPNACRTCKLCCIHLAQTALIWALRMSTHEISVLLFCFGFGISHSLLFTGFILALFFRKICLSVWNQALPSALRSLVEVKHESMRVRKDTHPHAQSRLSGFPKHLLLY